VAYSQNMTFRNIRIGNESGAAAIKPLSCNADFQRVCLNQGTASFQVLRATGFLTSELANQDTFNWLGQGVTLGSPHFPGFVGKKYLELFDVDANTSHGPFRDCNFNWTAKENECSKATSPNLARLVTKTSPSAMGGAHGKAMVIRRSP